MLLGGLALLLSTPTLGEEELIERAQALGMVFPQEVVIAAQPPEQPPEEVLVTIPPGAGLHAIARLLEQAGVVAGVEFEAAVRDRELDYRLPAGSYYLPVGDVEKVIQVLCGEG
ncbi:MAG TPA: endolytic transglycosylase MltG [Firmicutes bacterium]|nr:endolytic transglycosylase MltG [Bacillota bacterium]